MRRPLAAGLAGLLALALSAGAAGGAHAQTQPPSFGYNDEWLTHSDKLSLAAQGGADTTRAVISWRIVEPTQGQYNFAYYDELVGRIRAAGMRPLWVLADAPCWAWTQRPRKCDKKGLEPRPPKRGAYEEWMLFAATLAFRYPDTVAIETWNEPNLGNFFKPRPDPTTAAELAAWANIGVDYVNNVYGTNVPVLFGGLAPLYETIPKKKEVAYDEFMREAYEAIPGGYWDGVAIHPFPKFKARNGYLADIEEHLDALRSALFDGDAAGTPIWVTEIGLSTAGPFPYTPEKQARGLRKIYRSLDAMPDIAGIFIHRLIDGPKRLRTAESGWGVVQRNLTPKPALCALAAERGKPCG